MPPTTVYSCAPLLAKIELFIPSARLRYAISSAIYFALARKAVNLRCTTFTPALLHLLLLTLFLRLFWGYALSLSLSRAEGLVFVAGIYIQTSFVSLSFFL